MCKERNKEYFNEYLLQYMEEDIQNIQGTRG